jgi:hypothetical protein
MNFPGLPESIGIMRGGDSSLRDETRTRDLRCKIMRKLDGELELSSQGRPHVNRD